MKKAKFQYTKEDGSKTERQILNPTFLKESYNSYKDFEKKEVNYLSGIELIKENLTEQQILEYERTIEEYYSDIFMTLQEYLESKGLNPKNISQKTFKKEGIKNLDLLD